MQPSCNICNEKGLERSRKCVEEVWKEEKMKWFEAFGILIRKGSSAPWESQVVCEKSATSEDYKVGQEIKIFPGTAGLRSLIGLLKSLQPVKKIQGLVQKPTGED